MKRILLLSSITLALTAAEAPMPANPLAIQSLAQFVLYPKDIEATKAFYMDKLGFSLVYPFGSGPAKGYQLKAGDVGLTLLSIQGAPMTKVENLMIHIRVPDVDACCQAVQAKGVPLTHKLEDTDWGTRWFQVQDPDGLTLAFEQLKPKTAPEAKGPQNVKVLPSGEDRLVVTFDLPQFSPQEAYDLWIQPERLKAWWPPQAEIEPKVGGKYFLSWPDRKWLLEGRILAMEPGKRFAFSWKWNFEPKEKAPVEVDVDLARLEVGGTRVTITHGKYAAGEKAESGHLDGWDYFGGRMKALKAP